MPTSRVTSFKKRSSWRGAASRGWRSRKPFRPAGPPELFSTLIAADEAGRAVTVEVVQHLPDGRVRAVARDAAMTLSPGMQVLEREEIVGAPLTALSIRSALDRLVPRTASATPTLLETGIKVFFVGDGQASRDAFDTVIVMSRAVAAMKIWPAIDPLASTSRWLVADVVGTAHLSVATRVRQCLEAADTLEGREDLDAAARLTSARARKLRLFFAQPFFVAEPYTKRPGAFVPRADAIAACAAILDGAYDDVPDEAFYFTGGIDQVLARAR